MTACSLQSSTSAVQSTLAKRMRPSPAPVPSGLRVSSGYFSWTAWVTSSWNLIIYFLEKFSGFFFFFEKKVERKRKQKSEETKKTLFNSPRSAPASGTTSTRERRS